MPASRPKLLTHSCTRIEQPTLPLALENKSTSILKNEGKNLTFLQLVSQWFTRRQKTKKMDNKKNQQQQKPQMRRLFRGWQICLFSLACLWAFSALQLQAQEALGQTSPVEQTTIPEADEGIPASEVAANKLWYEKKSYHFIFSSSWIISQNFHRFHSGRGHATTNGKHAKHHKNSGYGATFELGSFQSVMFQIGYRGYSITARPFTKNEYSSLLDGAGVTAAGNITLKKDRLRTLIFAINKYFLVGKNRRHALILGLGWARQSYQLSGHYSQSQTQTTNNHDHQDTETKHSNDNTVAIGVTYVSTSHDDDEERFRKTIHEADGPYIRLGYQYLFPNSLVLGIIYENFLTSGARNFSSNENQIADSVLNNSNLQLSFGVHF